MAVEHRSCSNHQLHEEKRFRQQEHQNAKVYHRCLEETHKQKCFAEVACGSVAVKHIYVAEVQVCSCHRRVPLLVLHWLQQFLEDTASYKQVIGYNKQMGQW